MTSAPANKSFLRAGELARAAGVSTDTLHHYERKGLIPRPRRSPNGYREYPHDALERVRLVRRALRIGFTLEELAAILRARDRGDAPCREVRALAAAKLSEVEARLTELAAVRDELRTALAGWDARLTQTARGEPARLLDSLAASDAAKDTRRRLPPRQRKDD